MAGRSSSRNELTGCTSVTSVTEAAGVADVTGSVTAFAAAGAAVLIKKISRSGSTARGRSCVMFASCRNISNRITSLRFADSILLLSCLFCKITRKERQAAGNSALCA